MQTPEQLRERFARLSELDRKYRSTTDAAERRRINQQIEQLNAAQVEDAIAVRSAVLDHLDGSDAARSRIRDSAAGANAGSSYRGASGPSNDELRALCTPGSPTSQLWVTPTREEVMGPASAFAKRDHFITTDTGTIGSAYYYTPEMYGSVVMGLLAASGILEANPTLIVTNHLRPIQVPLVVADAAAAAGVEGSAATETHPTGGHIDLGAFRFDGVFNVSIEMIMAAEFNLDELLVTFATRSIANKVAAMLALGAGTTEPLGVFTSAAVTAGVTTASTTAAVMDEMLALTKSLPKGYRKQARLVTSDALHTSLLSYKDGQGDYLLRSIEGGGEQFAGKPMYTEPQADQSGMSAAEVHAVYGDFSGYFVRTTPMFFQRSDADPLNPSFVYSIWMDANVADASSLRSLVLHS